MNPTSATCCHKTILRKVLKIPYNWISIAGRAKLSMYVVLKRNRVSYIRYFKTQWHRVTVARNSLLILGYDALPKGGSMGGIVIKSYKFVVRNSMINQKQQQITNVSKQSGNHCSLMTTNKMGIRGRTRSPLFLYFFFHKTSYFIQLVLLCSSQKVEKKQLHAIVVSQ